MLIDSDIFVKINYSILTGALLCLECDIVIKHSDLQFIANGLQLSALILKSKETILIENTNISYRFSSNSSSGIVNQILNNIQAFSINNVVLTGYNDIQSALNGYLCSKVDVDIDILLNSMNICVDKQTQRVGQTQNLVQISNQESLQCIQVCNNNQYVTYGLCQQMIQFSTLLSNNTVMCIYPFEFNSILNECTCSQGYYLNITVCVNLVQELTQIISNMSILDLQMHSEITNVNIELKQMIYNLEDDIQSNISNLSEILVESYANLKQDINTTNGTLHENINSLRINFQQSLKQSNDLNSMTQTIIQNFRNESIYNSSVLNSKLNNINWLIDNNQMYIKSNFTQTQNQINDLKSLIGLSFDKVDTTLIQLKSDISNTNSSINNLNNQVNTIKTQINSQNDKINTIVTYNQFQTQIDQLKQQIQSVSVSISQSMTSSQFRCLMIAAYAGSTDYGSLNGLESYLGWMSEDYGCYY
ncbi:Hypothetical_protein [Hexamita inflata]|nr:Hypothetical protein HINF_LOCUS33784 [Hexamita inflata]CAI9946147.1 Hypothetical protein HINF_LOCUS33792 [Hexamita inflata]